ncbi:hypothetical protein BC831DRAFT_440910 [Entophlyctis helioformis]|nr:hypothetical protein BC831DRAFT_440910 [Entophlyctis helioformis]
MTDPAAHAPLGSHAVEIRPITDACHPAHTQRGLYATRRLAPHAHVLDYRGILVHDDDADPDSDYCIHFHGALSLDAADAGNEARFINDFRGVARRPNVAFDAYRDASDGRVRMGVFVMGNSVAAGDELLVTYGRDYWRARGIRSREPDWDPAWDEPDKDGAGE